MIELYRPSECPDCTEIETALREMVVAHKVITVEAHERPAALPADVSLPALKDNDKIIAGEPAIAAHLRELEKFVTNWRRFQGDACYIDEDGEPC